MIKVAKFGGSSLSNAENIRKVAEIILSDGDRKYIVVSAPGKCREYGERITDTLYRAWNEDENDGRGWDEIEKRFSEIAHELGVDIDPRELLETARAECYLDRFVSMGEYICGLILSEYMGYGFVDAAEVVRFSSSGELDREKTHELMRKALEKHQYAVIPGFYGSMPDGSIKTLPRGGSDITGALVAEAVGADIYENWTDVDGFMSSDPRVVFCPCHIPEISYSQLYGLSRMGAGVIQGDAIEPVYGAGIPINIKNTFNPKEKGTLITYSEGKCGGITAVSGKDGVCIFVVDGRACSADGIISGFCSEGVEIDGIYSSGEGYMVVAPAEKVAPRRRSILSRLCGGDGCCYIIDKAAILFVTGRDIRKDNRQLSKAISSLDRQGITPYAVFANRIDGGLIFLIGEEELEKGIRAVYGSLIKNKKR